MRLRIFIFIVLISLTCLSIIYLSNDGTPSAYYQRLEREYLKSLDATKYDEFKLSSMAYKGKKGSFSDKLLAELSAELPNVPFKYWIENFDNLMNSTTNFLCAKYPSLLSLSIYNKYWQSFQNRNVTMYLYGAYFDNRAGVEKGPVVRLLVMLNQIGIEMPQTFCHLWLDNVTAPAIVPVTKSQHIWYKEWGNKKGYFYPHILDCPLPENQKHLIPQTVSVSAIACSKPRNNLRVHYNLPAIEKNETKEHFAICVKGLNYPDKDISPRLIEWLELMRLFGVHKVFLHVLDIHPNIANVLKYYRDTEHFIEYQIINQVPANGTATQSVIYKRLNEVIPYNDCFYKNMYKYEYIAIVDIDEVIMPLANLTDWLDITNYVQFEYLEPTVFKKCPLGLSSICFHNFYFPISSSGNSSDLLKTNVYNEYANMYFMKYIKKLKEPSKTGIATKCFHNTSSAVTLHNHYSLSWFKNSCRPQTINSSIAQLQHYREVKQLKEIIEDNAIYKYGKALKEQTLKIFNKLNEAN